MSDKIFYFHVPKTAGTSINELFSTRFCNHVTHVESHRDSGFNIINRCDFVSGHVSFYEMDSIINLRDWVTLMSFREPYSYVVSHLSWIHKLSDEGEEKRFLAHPEIFQRVSLEMKKYNFTNPKDISVFISWLDEIEFKYLHNTQTFYLSPNKNVDVAKNNMNRVDYVFLTERVDEFVDLIGREFDLKMLGGRAPRSNVNINKYGFDLGNDATRKALYPLINKDVVIYEHAIHRFERICEMYTSKKIELSGWVDSISIGVDGGIKYSGWATSKKSYRHLEIGVYYGDELLSKTIAKGYRKSLKDKGLHHTGKACFSLTVPAEYNGNIREMSVKVVESLEEVPVVDGLFEKFLNS